MRDALMMHHPRGRLIQGLEADPPQAEAQVGILEIGRRVALVEAAQAWQTQPARPSARRRSNNRLRAHSCRPAWPGLPGGRNSSPMPSCQMMPPASCRRPSGYSSLAPTAPVSGRCWNSDTIGSSQPSSTCVSLLRNNRYWPCATAAALLQLCRNPRLVSLRISRMPRTRSRAAASAPSQASSTTITSIGSVGRMFGDRGQAAQGVAAIGHRSG